MMRALIILAAAALAGASGGCNLVFGLEAPAGDDDPGDDGGPPDDGQPDDGGGDGDPPPCNGVGDGGTDDGFDEDGDGVVDACDLCPHLFGPDLDNDGDGVGNACDPDPAMPNRIVFFEGFNTPGLAGWITSNSSWNQGDSAARQTDAELRGAHLLFDDVVPVNVQLDVGFTVERYAAGTPLDGIRAVGVFFHGDTVVVGEAPNTLDCQFLTNVAGANGVALLRWTAGVPESLSTVPANTPLETLAPYRLAAGQGLKTLRCQAAHDNGNAIGSAVSTPLVPRGRAVGLHTHYVAAVFRYVIVIERPATGGA